MTSTAFQKQRVFWLNLSLVDVVPNELVLISIENIWTFQNLKITLCKISVKIDNVAMSEEKYKFNFQWVCKSRTLSFQNVLKTYI